MAWLYYRFSDVGVIRIEGEDRYRFLQEITTNDISGITPERAAFTVLTNAAGRILDFLTVLEDQNALMVITQNGYRDATREYLAERARPKASTGPLAHMRRVEPRYDVAFQDESDQWEVSLLLPGEEPPPRGLIAPSQVGDVRRFQNRSAVLGLPAVFGKGVLMLQPRGVTVMVMMQAQLLDNVSFENERIRRGIPAPGSEIVAEFSPYEIGLGEFVALSKPSFPGKAILITEQRRRDRGFILKGLRLESPVEPPAYLRVGEKQIGRLTSCASTLAEPPHALAVVRKSFAKEDTEVVVLNRYSEHAVPAKLMDLPWQGGNEN